MNAIVHRHQAEVAHALIGFAWALGAAGLGLVALDVIAAAGIGAGMFVVVSLDLGPELGIPVYMTALVGVVVTFAAVVHVALALVERLTPPPSVVWPALAIHPLVLLVLEVFDKRDVYEPTLGIAGLLGICIAWLTTRRRLARQSPPAMSASNAPER